MNTVVDLELKKIMHIVVIVTNPGQCLSHSHDVDTAHNNDILLYHTYWHTYCATKLRLIKAVRYF